MIASGEGLKMKENLEKKTAVFSEKKTLRERISRLQGTEGVF